MIMQKNEQRAALYLLFFQQMVWTSALNVTAFGSVGSVTLVCLPNNSVN